MRTLGIDLASADRRTGVAVLEWTAAAGRLGSLEQPAGDDLIARLAGDCDAIAIDAPLGWPARFTDALLAHRRGQAWPDVKTIDLRYRRTDRYLAEEGIWPLSVSTDRIGIVAFRAARLLPLLGKGPNPARDGSAGVFEVYPAAALARWQQRRRGYKLDHPEHVDGRQVIAAWLIDHFGLDLAGRTEQVIGSSDLLDAVLCAVLAREAREGRTEPIPPNARALAREEGWIHLPVGNSPLAQLSPRPSIR